MDDRVVIALFRHGLTEENKRKSYLGWTDSPLCAEALKLATTSRYDHYFSSDLNRCITTAELLFPNAKLTLLKEFREMNFGIWERKTYEDLKAIPRYREWIANPFEHFPPEGESFQQFSRRIQTGWEKITRELVSHCFHSCAVVTHGGVLKYLLMKYAPERKDFWQWRVPHGHGLELVFDREALRRGERCTLLQEVPLTANEPG